MMKIRNFFCFPTDTIAKSLFLVLLALTAKHGQVLAKATITRYSQGFENIPTSFHENRHAHEQRLSIIAGSWADVDIRQHDRIASALDKSLGDAVNKIEGHSGRKNDERKVYTALARMGNVRRICEIGFNGGHSASLWLWANPEAEVVMFDLWEQEASPVGEQFLLSDEAKSLGIMNAASRLKIVKGNSLSTVTRFSAENPKTKCDLISVDGGHKHEIAIADIAHMHNLANPRFNTMLVDDTQCVSVWCVDAALEEHQRRGTLRKLLSISLLALDGSLSAGLSVGTYLH
jgi:hypothetical protein